MLMDGRGSRESCPACHGLRLEAFEKISIKNDAYVRPICKDGWMLIISVDKIKNASKARCSFCDVLLQAFEKFWREDTRGFNEAFGNVELFVSDEDHSTVIAQFQCFWQPGPFNPEWKLFFLRFPFLALSFSIPPSIPWHSVPSTVSNDSPYEPAKRILQWLERCMFRHKAQSCREGQYPTDMPSRLIDVRNPGGNQEPLLVETRHLREPYIALSHCWGKNPVITTTKQSYNCHTDPTHAIPWSSLTQTFKDAITLTRDLGINYIWIDSLCIVQDDVDDWRAEASRMGDVYHQALLTIAADGSSGGQGGCFTRPAITHFEDRLRQPGDVKYISAWNMEAHGNLDRLADSDLNHQAMKGNIWPLLTRGWTFQERLLASRVVHFTPTELMWECGDGVNCECDFVPESFTSMKLLYGQMRSADFESRADQLSTWYDLVRAYTARNLTKDADRLPAISALAKRMMHPKLGQYKAGMWTNHLVVGLLWEANVSGPVSYHRSTVEYVAPSWSWASIIGDIKFEKSILQSADTAVILTTVVTVECQLAGTDPFGSINDAELILSCPTLDTRFIIRGGSVPSIEMPEDRQPLVYLDIGQQDGQYIVKTGAEVKCLFILRRRGVQKSTLNYVGLITRSSPRVLGAFERIGLFYLTVTDVVADGRDGLTDVQELIKVV